MSETALVGNAALGATASGCIDISTILPVEQTTKEYVINLKLENVYALPQAIADLSCIITFCARFIRQMLL